MTFVEPTSEEVKEHLTQEKQNEDSANILLKEARELAVKFAGVAMSQVRQSYSQDLQKVLNPDFSTEFSDFDDCFDRISPYHILSCPPIEDIHFLSSKPADLQLKLDSINDRYSQLLARSEFKIMTPEIHLLQEKLALEEEKFIFNKLKAEVTTKYKDKIKEMQKMEYEKAKEALKKRTVPSSETSPVKKKRGRKPKSLTTQAPLFIPDQNENNLENRINPNLVDAKSQQALEKNHATAPKIKIKLKM